MSCQLFNEWNVHLTNNCLHCTHRKEHRKFVQLQTIPWFISRNVPFRDSHFIQISNQLTLIESYFSRRSIYRWRIEAPWPSCWTWRRHRWKPGTKTEGMPKLSNLWPIQLTARLRQNMQSSCNFCPVTFGEKSILCTWPNMVRLLWKCQKFAKYLHSKVTIASGCAQKVLVRAV